MNTAIAPTSFLAHPRSCANERAYRGLLGSLRLPQRTGCIPSQLPGASLNSRNPATDIHGKGLQQARPTPPRVGTIQLLRENFLQGLGHTRALRCCNVTSDLADPAFPVEMRPLFPARSAACVPAQLEKPRLKF